MLVGRGVDVGTSVLVGVGMAKVGVGTDVGVGGGATNIKAKLLSIFLLQSVTILMR